MVEQVPSKEQVNVQLMREQAEGLRCNATVMREHGMRARERQLYDSATLLCDAADELEWSRAAPEPPAGQDEVLVALKRPEGYEDVHPEIVAEDAIRPEWPEYRTLQRATQPPEPVPDELFNGYEVYHQLSARAKARTSSENVSDVLDTVVRMIRARATATKESAQ